MDVFSLLKFWRNAGVGDPTNSGDIDITDDEGSFFDLVFTTPNSPSLNVITGLHTDYYYHFSKLDGDSKSKSTPQTVFCNNKSKIIPLDSSSNSSSSTSSSKTCRSPFRALKLGFQFQNSLSKFEKKEMKCEIEEVTISSLLNRDNSLRNKFRSEKLLDDNHDQIHSKRFSKEIVHKYLNLIKPLYVKVYKKSNEKVKLPEYSSPFTSSSQVTGSPFGKTMLKEVRKHLGKSRSSSSSNGNVKNIPSPLVRRDDSALQQQDGIQSAILHCKQSYNSPGCHVLSRSGSAPSHGPRISVDEAKRCSI